MRKLLGDMVKGAAVFAAVGALIGVIFLIPGVTAAFASIGVVPAITSAISGGTWWPIAVEAFSFGLFGALVPPVQKIFGLCFGDADAKNAAAQNQETIGLRARVNELESREQMLEEALRPSQTVHRILADGPSKGGSFAEAELQRDSAQKAPTVH